MASASPSSDHRGKQAIKTQAWFRIHSFAGTVTGLLLFVICFSGTFAVLAKEIDWLVTPEARVGPAAGGTLDWPALYDAVRVAYPTAVISWMEAPLYSHSAAQFVVNLPHQDSVRVYVDPYRGEVLGQHSYFNVQRFFRSFHMNLFLSPFGDYLVAAFALTMLVSLVAALYVYKRWWTRFFRFRRGQGRVFWSELHKTAGLWSLWFLLVLATTGGWYLFEMLRVDVGDGKVAWAGAADYAVNPIRSASVLEESGDRTAKALEFAALIDRVRSERPDIDIRNISPGTADFSGDGVFYVDGQSEHWLVRDRANQIHLDGYTGAVLYNQRPTDYSLYWRWSDTADPLHFGDFAGLLSKATWFVFGLVLSGLILTGTWLHAHRLAHGEKSRSRHRWPGMAAAIAVSILVLAASVPGGFREASVYYGPEVDGVRVLPTLAPGVKAVIVCWSALLVGIVLLWAAVLWRPALVMWRASWREAPSFRGVREEGA